MDLGLPTLKIKNRIHHNDELGSKTIGFDSKD